jgi:Tol biopolymer transport system component
MATWRFEGGHVQGTGIAQFAVSSSGVLTYLPGPASLSMSGDADLALFDRKGLAQPLKLPPGNYRSPRVSPDGRQVVFDTEDDREAIVWIYELAGGTAARRLTFGGKNRHPIWSGDGQWVAFQSDREGDLAIFRQRADGSGTAERVTKPESGAEHVPQAFSPNGAHLLFAERKGTEWALWTMTMADRKPALFEGSQSVELAEAAFSPDGKWLAYQAREPRAGATRDVYLQPFPPTGARYLVRSGNVGHPYWTPRGDALILNTGSGLHEIIPVKTASGVAFGQAISFPRMGRVESSPAIVRRNVDSMPDGEHVIGVTISSGATMVDAPGGQIIVVLNWFDEVRRKMSGR